MDNVAVTAVKKGLEEPPVEETWDVLLSYAAEDVAWVKALADRLKKLQLRVFDPYATSAEFWGRSLDEVVSTIFPAKCPVAFVMLSSAFAASEQCGRELSIVAETALNVPLSLMLPARLDDSPVPEAIRSVAILDARSAPPENVADGVEARIREWRASATRGHLSPEGAPQKVSNEAMLGALINQVRKEVALHSIYPQIDAEEVIQAAVCDVFMSLQNRESRPPLPYLRAIVRSSVEKQLLKRRREMVSLRSRIDDIEKDHPAPLTPWEEQEEVNRVRQAIERLSPREQEIITLRYTDGLTYAEVAERMGLSVHSVRVQMQRMLSKLRALLGTET